MRAASKNKKAIWVSKSLGRVACVDGEGYATGDFDDSFSAPEKMFVNVSANKGDADEEPFGAELEYTKKMAFATDVPLNEGDRVWIETAPPEGQNDGHTADYVIVAAARSLNGTVFALKMVTKDGT